MGHLKCVSRIAQIFGVRSRELVLWIDSGSRVAARGEKKDYQQVIRYFADHKIDGPHPENGYVHLFCREEDKIIKYNSLLC